MKTAQDYYSVASGGFMGGFNQRLFGEERPHRAADFAEPLGWDEANRKIGAGEIFYTHNFKCPCGDHAFKYGGSWVCNGCGRSGVDEPWWIIRVQKDGSAWVVTGEGFENLQESENYAFGDTKKEALDAYKKLMRDPPATDGEVDQ